jgi:hypothetical protein
MNTVLERDGFEERLLPMLRESLQDGSPDVRGQRSAPRRPARRFTFVGVAAALALLAGVLVAGVLGAGSAVSGRQLVTVDGHEALRDPNGVEEQLRAAGIDATIVDVPLPSSHHGLSAHGLWEGAWWWVTFDEPAQLTQDEFDRLYAQVGMLSANSDITRGDRYVLELPKIPGHVTLFVGREVPEGKFSVFRYDRMNELSPVGAFYCLGIDPNDPVALGGALTARGYRIIWLLESAQQSEDVTAPPPDTVATWAWLRGPDLVDIRLAPAGKAAERYQSAEGTFPLDETPPWARRCD